MTRRYLRGPSLPWFVLLILCRCVLAELNNETSPTYRFRSRPDIHAPIIDMTILRPELLVPGYLFLAPYRNVAPGPYIYDNYGELVWAGAGSAGPKTAHMPHVCQYQEKDHLCYFQGDQHHGFARGFGVIMDNSYRIVKTVESAGAGASSDMHEFRLAPYSNGKTALVTVYQTQAYDLTINPRFNLRYGMGWITDSVFQEIDVETGHLLFEWRSLDHVDPALSWVMPGTTDTSGTGVDSFNAWDYFHINSVDKNKDGDYLVSARHLSAIYKLSGKDGHIIWQLGGSTPTIECEDFAFGYQHEVRWVSENMTHTVLSFFDNAGNDYNYTSQWSRGVIVSINHGSSTAVLVKSWGAPEPQGGIKSGSQGNMQLLPDGGCHISWGEHAHISEHTADGSAVMYGKLALRESNVMIYRSYKFPWTAYPKTNPSIWTFSKSGNDESGTRLYVSWNGATEVRHWRLFSASSALGPFTAVAVIGKRGFETEFSMPQYTNWTYAEALDAEGRTMAQSPVTRTFVPSKGLLEYCDERGCRDNEGMPDDEKTPYTADVATPSELASYNRGYDTRRYYMDATVRGGPPSRSRHSSSSMLVWLTSCVVVVLLLLSSAGRRLLVTTVLDVCSMVVSVVQWVLVSCTSGTGRHRKGSDKDEWEMLSTSSGRS